MIFIKKELREQLFLLKVNRELAQTQEEKEQLDIQIKNVTSAYRRTIRKELDQEKNKGGKKI